MIFLFAAEHVRPVPQGSVPPWNKRSYSIVDSAVGLFDSVFMFTWKKTWGVFGILLISQIALRALLFCFQYEGLNYFGGDSGVYYMTAENLEMKNHFWPIG